MNPGLLSCEPSLLVCVYECMYVWMYVCMCTPAWMHMHACNLNNLFTLHWKVKRQRYENFFSRTWVIVNALNDKTLNLLMIFSNIILIIVLLFTLDNDVHFTVWIWWFRCVAVHDVHKMTLSRYHRQSIPPKLSKTGMTFFFYELSSSFIIMIIFTTTVTITTITFLLQRSVGAHTPHSRKE